MSDGHPSGSARQQSLRELSGKGQYRQLMCTEELLRPGPSLVWRGDSILLGSQLPRWAWRAHYREGAQESRWTGFANLRPLDEIPAATAQPTDDLPSVAEAYLAPPRRLRGDDCRIYPGAGLGILYGYRDDEFDFDGQLTCFSMPYRSYGGVCAHACTFMSSVVLSELRRGLSIPAVHEMSFHVAQWKSELTALPDGTSVFPVRGLDFEEIRWLLLSDLIKGGAILERFHINSENRGNDRLRVAHVVHQYMRQGLPVILRVDCGRLDPEDYRKLSEIYPDRETFPHAVVLVGTRFRRAAGRVTPAPGTFVYHDPRTGPYLEKSVEALLHAAEYKQNCVLVVVAAPPHVSLRLTEVTRAFYTGRTGRTRAWRWPLRRSRQRTASLFSLLPREDLAEAYFSHLSPGHELRRFLDEHEAALPEWIWGAELYSSDRDLAVREASTVWLFDATRGKRTNWPASLFAVCQDEAFRSGLGSISPCRIIVKGRLPVRTRRLQEGSAWRHSRRSPRDPST